MAQAEQHDDGAPAWFRFGRSVLLLAMQEDSASDQTTDAELDKRRDEFERARDDVHRSLEEESPFSALAANASLSAESTEMLALLATAESDRDMQILVSKIQFITGKARLTLGGVSRLLGADHPAALTVAADAQLRRSGFLEIVPEGAWVDHVVALHPTVVWALLGDTSADTDLPHDATPFDDDPATNGLPHDAPTPQLLGPVNDFLVVNGADRVRRRQYGARLAPSTRFLRVDAPESAEQWSAIVREATITGRTPLVEVGDTLPLAGRQWIERSTHLAWVLCSAAGPALVEMPRRAWAEVTAPAELPTDDEWLAAFGPGVGRTHDLTADQLERVVPAYAAIGSNVDGAVRRLASGHLDKLTQRIRPTRTWEDLVVSPDRREILQSLVDRYHHSTQVYDSWGFAPTPSRGLVALFSGPSGTGKTLAAEIIAGELGLDVFKLDLSSVVSKYIGETEKNLEQVFDAASAGNLVLFFDEADSLFGKRSEVKDARDRYANIEVSYLLQRIESYDGLVILATNYEKNIDQAFLRRIHSRVAFEMPGTDERASIWRRNLPPQAPVDDLDIDWLASRFELSGAAIRNSAIQAAFAAAAADGLISMERAVLGVAREYRKMGRLVKKDDFGEFADAVMH